MAENIKENIKAVELKDVSFSYENGINIFENISFEANFKEITLLSGYSGQGKSTLMYIISGIIPNIVEGELKGKVLINGKDIKGERLGSVCRKVGVVLQNADEQIIQKYVEDEISFGCENLAFKKEKIKEQIDITCSLMKLDKNWKCRTLSGGQKQRLITASTLAMGQRIIILDEPLANLDKGGALQLMHTLTTLKKAGYAVIIIEHRLDVVLPFVDSVWHIGEGKVEKIENKQEYLSSQTAKITDICELSQSEEALFELKNVAFSVKEREILKDINFNVIKGARTVLLGENGTGKTTIMRLIARLNKCSDGKIVQHIDEKFAKKPKGNKEWFKRVGVVYQNPDYQLFMPTVEREIKFLAKSEEYADKIAKLFDVQKLYNRHPQSLSEGQKRRVSIVAVLATKPEVLLLDEPTVGQDYKGLCDMVDIINAIHKEEKNTIITVTHDVRCAEALCDNAVLIGNGVVLKTGKKQLIRDYFNGIN